MPKSGAKSGESVEPIYREVGARIKWLREQRGWGPGVLSARLGLHPTTLHTWEKAIIRVKLSELVRLADALGAPLDVFLADLRVTDAQPTTKTLEMRERMKQHRKDFEAAKKAGNKTGKKARKKAKKVGAKDGKNGK